MSDQLGIIAHPLTVIIRNNQEQDVRKIREILEEYSPVEMVVGLPLNMNGTSGSSVQKVLSFIKYLKKQFSIPITTCDERLTTVYSEKVLLSADLSRQKRKKIIDKVAAALILQSYLDIRRTESGKTKNM